MNKDTLLLQNLRIIDPESPFHQKVSDVMISEGLIIAIGNNLKPGTESKIIDFKGSNVSPGIFDLQVRSGEPGFEEKETLSGLSQAALAGGVTDVLLMPSLNPVTDHRGQVEYLRKISAEFPVGIYIAGALSSGMKGQDLAELYDMRQGGAVAFTDDKSPVENTVLLHLALQYAKVSGGLIMVHGEDPGMRLGGMVHEGESATRIGMKGTPGISEELGVMRCLTLARYHDAPIHFSGISTRGSVALIRDAKKSGSRVSCSVYAHHLYFTDNELQGFDSNFKVWPPLRTEDDRQALLEGLSDHTIDIICSDHRPENRENKEVEFDFAAYGMRGVETLFAAAYKVLTGDLTDLLIQKMVYAPRKILGIPVPVIAEGNEARFFVYRDEPYRFNREMIPGVSLNNPFLGRELRGIIQGTYTAAGGWIGSEA
jgi:dihydroorotase